MNLMIAIVLRSGLCSSGTSIQSGSVAVDQCDRCSTYPSDNDYSSSQEGPSHDPSSDVPEHIEEQIDEHTLTPEEAIQLTRNVVEATRQEMRQTLRGTEDAGGALKLSLTIDLSRRGIEEMPDEMVQILKQDVERYAHGPAFGIHYRGLYPKPADLLTWTSRLTLSYNSISQIPNKFSECANLTYLNLRGNCLEEVPRAVSSPADCTSE